MKTLRKFDLVPSWLIALALAIVLCSQAHAQFVGYTGLQTTQQVLATNVACTGVAQGFFVNNLGQAYHYASISTVGTTQLSMQIQGLDSKGNAFVLSDTAVAAASGGTRTATVYGVGYYPQIQVVISCLPSGGAGTFSLSYSGAYASFGPKDGSYLKSELYKFIFSNVPGNTNANGNVDTPFGTTAGSIGFQYNGASAGGGTLTVQCDQGNGAFVTVFSGSIANSNSLQVFPLPNVPCITANVIYGNSGAAGTVITTYLFALPGTLPVGNVYNHIVGTTATVVKATAGFLHTVSVNTGAVGTVSVFDLVAASCTGTPATNTVAVITATVATLQTFTYDTNFSNGICVKASVAMDLTVSSQ